MRPVPHLSKLLAALLLVVSCAACSTVFPSNSDTLATGLGKLGELKGQPDGADVVLVPDLHETHGGVTGGGPHWTRHRKWQMRALRFLALKGWTLLGAEHREGRLPDDELARSQRRTFEDANESGIDPDSLNLYMPLRVQWEIPQLTVLGVEDRELYDADVRALEDINRLRRSDGISEDQKNPAIYQLVTSIVAHKDARGRAAAANLHAAMLRLGHQRAVLLLGAGHIASAHEELTRLGHRVILFRSDALEPVLHSLR